MRGESNREQLRKNNESWWLAPVVPLFWNIRDKVILKVLLRVLARQNPNFLSCAVPAQRSTNIILYSLFFFNLV